MTFLVHLFTRSPICKRRALHALYSASTCQRRAFYVNEIMYRWSSPVLKAKSPNVIQKFKLPENIDTFHPQNITDRHFIDISKSALADINLYRRIARDQKMDPHMRQFGQQLVTSHIPWPEDLRGFFYYHSPAKESPINGGLRFRVTDTPTRDGFLQGKDLLMPHGLPWAIPIDEIATRAHYQDQLLGILVRDGFAPPHLQKALVNLDVIRDSNWVSAFGQSWPVDWQTEYSRIYLLPPGYPPVPVMVTHPWYNKRGKPKSPFTGSGVVTLVRGDKTSGHPYMLRVKTILSLTQHGVNENAVRPSEGMEVPFEPLCILKTTKRVEKKRQGAQPAVDFALKRLPNSPAESDPMDFYRYTEPIFLERRQLPDWEIRLIQTREAEFRAKAEALHPLWSKAEHSLPRSSPPHLDVKGPQLTLNYHFKPAGTKPVSS
ncbi:unnamed protein product [Mycena citricolor]|uniref:Uncharacterized protein n=1 Tax=Mycena citricolor TaxID=2018698 RepID=A0AAD2HAG6_9AGAR|nr:unnamed protein product [Mycena citricolor]